MAVALVVAAGRGERLGSARPKALVAVAGRPMLEWSVLALRAVAAIDEIVVALPAGAAPPPGTIGVAGGAYRSLSVRTALRASEGDPVVVHDAARPLVTPAIVEAVLAGLAGVDAAIAAAPMTDTIKRAADGLVVKTLDRRGLWAVQTPQAFHRAVLEDALGDDEAVLALASDDASLVEARGGTVRVVPCPAGNLKVTTAQDLRVAERVLDPRERC